MPILVTVRCPSMSVYSPTYACNMNLERSFVHSKQGSSSCVRFYRATLKVFVLLQASSTHTSSCTTHHVGWISGLPERPHEINQRLKLFHRFHCDADGEDGVFIVDGVGRPAGLLRPAAG